MKKSLITLATVAALGFAAGSANASNINVGGVVWNPDAVTAFPSLVDFNASGTVFENFAANIGDTVTGFGLVERINSGKNNESSFCPGCELTFTFSMDLASATFNSAVDAAFVFTNLKVNVFVDNALNFAGTLATAGDGLLWLALEGNGNLAGIGKMIGTGSDQGSGSSLLDVTGGLAKGNFDTNGEVNGADMVFTSQFQPLADAPGVLEGGVKLTGNSIPEPGSIALIGLGLLGLAARRRKA